MTGMFSHRFALRGVHRNDARRRVRSAGTSGEAATRRSTAGFTLVEMLAALAIVSLLTAMVALGVNAGIKIYKQNQFVSQAQILSDNINSALSDPMRFAEATSATDWQVVYQDDNTNGLVTDPLLVTVDGQIYITNAQGTLVKLLNGGVYGNCKISNIVLTQPTITASGSSYTLGAIQGTYTVSDKDDSTGLSRTYSFYYMPLSGVSKGSTTTKVSASLLGESNAMLTKEGIEQADADHFGDRTEPTPLEVKYTEYASSPDAQSILSWSKATDANGNVYWTANADGTPNSSLVYYNDIYYRPNASGLATHTVLPTSEGTGSLVVLFDVSQLTGGGAYDYGWGEITWTAMS